MENVWLRALAAYCYVTALMHSHCCVTAAYCYVTAAYCCVTALMHSHCCVTAAYCYVTALMHSHCCVTAAYCYLTVTATYFCVAAAYCCLTALIHSLCCVTAACCYLTAVYCCVAALQPLWGILTSLRHIYRLPLHFICAHRERDFPEPVFFNQRTRPRYSGGKCAVHVWVGWIFFIIAHGHGSQVVSA